MVEVKAGLCRYNYKCHLNTVHDAVNNNEGCIAMLVCFDKREPKYSFIHFVNVSIFGEYTDNTLGYWIKDYNCYLIKEIGMEDFDRIGDIFDDYRKHIKSILPFYHRLFHKLDDI